MEADRSESVSPPYNMGLTGTRLKPFWSRLPVSLKLDKLRLRGTTLTGAEEVLKSGPGLVHRTPLSRGRNSGDERVYSGQAWLFNGKGKGPNVWVLAAERPDQRLRTVDVSWNPQTLPGPEQRFLGQWIASYLDIDPCDMWVERYDGALDYGVERSRLRLYDGRRSVDQLEVGPSGPQTERAGFRKGSRRKTLIYDKTAERRAKGDRSCPDDRTRVEHQVQPCSGDVELRLRDLGAVAYPGGSERIMLLRYRPEEIDDPNLRLLVRLAAVGAVGEVVAELKRSCNASKRERVLWSLFGEPEPSPAEVWADQWASVVRCDTAAFLGRRSGEAVA